MSKFPPSKPSSINRSGTVVAGIMLVGLGMLYLMRNLGLFHFSFFTLRIGGHLSFSFLQNN